MKYSNHFPFTIFMVSIFCHSPATKTMEAPVEKATWYTLVVQNKTDGDIVLGYDGKTKTIKASKLFELEDLQHELKIVGVYYKEHEKPSTVFNMKDIYTSEKRKKGEEQTLDILLMGSKKQDEKTGKIVPIKYVYNWVSQHPLETKAIKEKPEQLKELAETKAGIVAQAKAMPLPPDVERKLARDTIQHVIPYLMKERFVPKIFNLGKEEVGITLNKDKSRIFSCSPTNCCIKNLVDGKNPVCIGSVENIGVSSTSFNGSGSILALGDKRNECSIWDTRTGKQIKKLFDPQDPDEPVTNVVFNPDDTLLGVSSFNNTVLFNTKTWKITHTLPVNSRIGSIAFSPDKETIVVAQYMVGTLTSWSTKTGEKLHILPRQVKFTFNPDGNSLAFSPDGKTVVAGCFGETLLIWDPKSTKQSYIHGLTGNVVGLACSLYKNRFIIAAYTADGVIELWFPNDKEPWAVLTNVGKVVRKDPSDFRNQAFISFSQDGMKLYVFSGKKEDTGVRMYDLLDNSVAKWLDEGITLPQALLVEKAYSQKEAGKSFMLRPETEDYKIFVALREKSPLIATYLINKLSIKLL